MIGNILYIAAGIFCLSAGIFIRSAGEGMLLAAAFFALAAFRICRGPKKKQGPTKRSPFFPNARRSRYAHDRLRDAYIKRLADIDRDFDFRGEEGENSDETQKR